MSAELGRSASSKIGLYGNDGTSGAATLWIGASRYSNPSLATIAATSAPIPPVMLSSWTMQTLPVLRTDSSRVTESRGLTVRKSITSQLMPLVERV